MYIAVTITVKGSINSYQCKQIKISVFADQKINILPMRDCIVPKLVNVVLLGHLISVIVWTENFQQAAFFKKRVDKKQREWYNK